MVLGRRVQGQNERKKMERLEASDRLRLLLGLCVRGFLQLQQLSRYKECLKLQQPDREAGELLECSAQWLEAIRSGIRTTPTEYEVLHGALSMTLAGLVPENVPWQRNVAEWLEDIAMNEPTRVSLEKLLSDVGVTATSARVEEWFSEHRLNRCALLRELLQKLKEIGLINEVQAMAEGFAEEVPPCCTKCNLERQLEENCKETVDGYLKRFLEFLVTFKADPKSRRASPYRRLAESMLNHLLKPPDEKDWRKRRGK